MDSVTSSALSIGSIVISLLGSIVAVINHKRIRSNCCGAKTEVSLDIENTTPGESKKDSFAPNPEKKTDQ